MPLLRVRAVGTGWTGGPGLSTFYFDSGVAAVDAALATGVTGRVRAYFDAVKAYYSTGVAWTVDPVVDALDPTDGSLSGQVVAGSAPATVVGTAAVSSGPAFVAAVGKLRTNTFWAGRRIQGRTFLSPLANTFTDSTSVEGGLQAAQTTGLNAILTAGGGPGLVVWHRPKNGAGGFMAGVVSVSSSSTFGVLKSRR